MNSPLFRRFPHYLAPFNEAVTPALEWDFEGCDLILRPHGGDLERVWVYLGRRDVGERLQNPRTERTAGNRIRGAYKVRRFWRAWPLESGELALLRGNFGLMRFADDALLARFELPKHAFSGALQAFEASGARLDELLGAMEADENSDLHAARRWRARQNEVWGNLIFERGTPAEFEKVLTALAQLFLDPQQSQFWVWSAKTDANGHLDFPWVFFPDIFLPRTPAQIERFTHIVSEILQSYFAVRLAPDASRGYEQMGDPTTFHLPKLSFPIPSMHEKLEAQLFLRAWLQGKTSDENIELLREILSG